MKIRKKGNLFFVNTKAKLPINLIEIKQILYIYQLETSDSNNRKRVIKHLEHQFIEQNQVRVLNIELESQKKEARNYFQYDGLVFFHNQPQISLNDFKNEYIVNSNPIQMLNNSKAFENASFITELFEEIQRLFLCLSNNDAEYKHAFDNVILQF